MEPTNDRDPNYYHKVVDCQWACPAHTDVPGHASQRVGARGLTGAPSPSVGSSGSPRTSGARSVTEFPPFPSRRIRNASLVLALVHRLSRWPMT
jgi:hypothetical protein